LILILFYLITGIAGYCRIKEIKYLNNDQSLKGGSPHFFLNFLKRGIKRNEKKKEVKSKMSKGGCLHHYSKKKTAVELGDRMGDRMGDRIGSLPFFCVS
jgi:hypothetical protein